METSSGTAGNRTSHDMPAARALRFWTRNARYLIETRTRRFAPTPARNHRFLASGSTAAPILMSHEIGADNHDGQGKEQMGELEGRIEDQARQQQHQPAGPVSAVVMDQEDQRQEDEELEGCEYHYLTIFTV